MFEDGKLQLIESAENKNSKTSYLVLLKIMEHKNNKSESFIGWYFIDNRSSLLQGLWKQAETFKKSLVTTQMGLPWWLRQ